MKAMLILSAALSVLIPAASQAANKASDVCKGGQLVIVRLSQIKPEGSEAGFKQAVADNQAWYVAHGMTKNKQVGGVVLDFDSKTGQWSRSKDMVASVHVDPPGSDAGAQDAAWKAFVAKYDANSKITNQAMICLDKPLR